MCAGQSHVAQPKRHSCGYLLLNNPRTQNNMKRPLSTSSVLRFNSQATVYRKAVSSSSLLRPGTTADRDLAPDSAAFHGALCLGSDFLSDVVHPVGSLGDRGSILESEAGHPVHLHHGTAVVQDHPGRGTYVTSRSTDHRDCCVSRDHKHRVHRVYPVEAEEDGCLVRRSPGRLDKTECRYLRSVDFQSLVVEVHEQEHLVAAAGGRSLAEAGGRGHSVVVDASQLASKLVLYRRPQEEVADLFCHRTPLLVDHDQVVGGDLRGLFCRRGRSHSGIHWAQLRLQPTRQDPSQRFHQQVLEAELAASPDCRGVLRPARDCRCIAEELLVLPEAEQS